MSLEGASGPYQKTRTLIILDLSGSMPWEIPSFA